MKIKPSNWWPARKTIRCRPAQTKYVKFGPHAKTEITRAEPKPISIPHTKTKEISNPTLNCSKSRCTAQKTNYFDPNTEIRSISIATLYWSQFRCAETNKPSHNIRSKHYNQYQFRHQNQNQVHFNPSTESKSVNTSCTEIKSNTPTYANIKYTWIPTLNLSQCLPVHENRALFDDPHQNQADRSPR